jgi:hypothetical protein
MAQEQISPVVKMGKRKTDSKLSAR